MKIEALKQRAGPGSEVAFLMAGGAEIKGRVVRFEESLVVIEQGGRERTLFGESITGFEVIPTPMPEPPEPDPAPHQPATKPSRPPPTAAPVVGEGVGLVQLPTAPPRLTETPIHTGEGTGRGAGDSGNDDAALTWARALEHVDAIRKALVTADQPCEQALAAAQAFANEFIQAPAWVHRDSNVRYLLIQAFKAVEHQQKLRDAGSPEALLLSQTLLALNRPLRLPAGTSDEERFVDLYHINVAVRTHLEHYRNDEAIWKELGDSLREAQTLGTKVLNQPNFATLWEREPHRRKTFFYRLSEICHALVSCGFAPESESERLLQRANEYSLMAGGQPLVPAPVTNAMGTIVTFGAKQFGFIHTKDQRDLFFTLNDVISAALRAKLIGSRDQLEVEVDFEEEPQPTRRCDRAVRIRQPGFIVGRLKRLPRLERPEFGFLELSDGREAHCPFSTLPDVTLTPQIGECFLCHVVRNPKGWTVDRADPLVSDVQSEQPDPEEGDNFDTGPRGTPTRNGHPDRAGGGGSGRITSFGNQGFGFIDTRDGRTLFFRIEDVVDSVLHQQLLDPNLPIGAEVVFNEQDRPYGQSYNRAIAISLAGADQLLKRAAQLGAAKQFREALEVVRSVQRLDAASTEAVALGRELQQKLIRAEKLPHDNSNFSRAKRAWVLDQDLGTAERLYRLAISRGERLEAAVKDLASLLQQMRRPDEAIELLEEHSNRRGGQRAFDGTLATAYEHAHRYAEAAEVLSRMERHAHYLSRPVILRRIAFAHFRLKQFDLAERTLATVLELRPTDPGAERLLAAVQQAKRAGSDTKTDEVIAAVGDLADYSGGLTGLSQAMLDECSFEGVAPNKVESKGFALRDVDELIDLAKTLGTKRPRDRAAYNLSAAAILRELKLTDDRRFLECLRLYFRSMGDAAAADKKHPDAVRTFFTESLALSNELSEGDRITLRQYLISYASPAAQDKLSRLPLEPSEALLRVWQDLGTNQGTTEPLLSGVLYLSVQSRLAFQTLWNEITRDRTIFQAFANHLGCPTPASHKSAQEKLEQRRTWLAEQLRKLSINCEALTKLRLTTASLEDLLARLRSLDREILSDLDRQRLTALSLIAEDAASFCRAAEFEERERHYFTLKIGAEKLSKEVKDSPTRFSFESLLAVVKHLASLVEESYADLARSSVPEVKLELVNDSYIPNRGNQGDEVTLQLQLSNRAGCGPASNIELQVGPADSPFFQAQQDFTLVADALRGGRTADRHWRLRVTQAAKEQRAFPVNLRARFQNSMGQKVTGPETQFTVKLYPESEFRRIENPYAPHAHGGAVKDSKMFFGRDEFIQQICSALMASGGTKSILIHGQKRAGKTSVLDHLTRKLSTMDCLPVSFSLRSGAFTQTDFLYRILQETRDAVENEVMKRPGLVQFDLPTLPEFASHPAILFHECLGQFLRKCRATGSWRDIRPVLLIDEFTDIFSEIQQGNVPRDFMKLWKAIIEKGYFSCVLAGKDILPAFKREFPNEFGVIDPKRITYLTDRYARELIEIPIGSKRYKSNAVGRILELTAGSPFYTMMFCDKLVEHMNRTRSLVVTEADVEKVKESLVSGHDFLDKVEFDPLYAAGEGKIDTGIDPAEAFSVCAAVAKKSERAGWCSKTALIGLPLDLEAHLLDLHDRDVLECKGDSYRIKVGLFREWMLVNT